MAAITLDTTNLPAAETNGLTKRVQPLRARLAAEHASGKHAHLALSEDQEALEHILRVAQPHLGRFRHLVVIGIGGSALGLRALVGALTRPSDKWELFVIDSTDPWLFADVLARIDLRHSLFVVVSKSGSTPETVAALGLFSEKLKVAKLPLSEHLLAVTDSTEGPLRAFADAHDLDTAEIPPAVGGRFSVLSAAGLLPAALLNIDVAALLRGAARARATCLGADPARDWAAQLGLCAVEQFRKGKSSLVFMPYSARMRAAADWFTQLWDESLGKDGMGQTVIPATGPTDQHSQLQLFLEGPKDKLMLFVRVQHHMQDLHLGDFEWDRFDAGYVKGRSLGQIIDAQWAGTARACTESGLANITLNLPQLDAEYLGELLMGLQAAAGIAAMELGVNAYNQPAVERGKLISRKMLGG